MVIYLKIGIIGGSGLDDPDIIDNRTELIIDTPYGKPSDNIISGTIGSVPCALVARHGRSHSIMPTNVNYRANIWALKSIGCTHVIASTATGSLKEEYAPGDLIVPHDFIDRTSKRHQTFYDGNDSSPKGVCHLPFAPAYHERSRKILIEAIEQLGFSVHKKAIVVAIEGPRFSSHAESKMYRQWGGDLINMTTCPEVILAKEAGILYASLAIVTDYDCWRDKKDSVTVTNVTKILTENISKIKRILTLAVTNISKEDWTQDIYDLKEEINKSIMK